MPIELFKIWEAAKLSKGITIRELVSRICKEYSWKRGQVRLQTIRALREGYLRIIESNVDFEESIIEATDKIPPREQIEEKEREALKVATKLKDMRNEVSIVATIPERLRNVCHGAVPYEELYDTFSDLLRQANEIVRLSLPFIEPNGIWIFLDDIATALSKGVSFRILTREIYEPRGSTAWVRKVKALMKLIELARRYGQRGDKQIKIRDFHTTLVTKDFRYQFESSHAKILIADNSIAYVGSGEWRENSLFYNFEVGVVLKGPIVEELIRLYDIIWDHSKEVTYETLKGYVMPLP